MKHVLLDCASTLNFFDVNTLQHTATVCVAVCYIVLRLDSENYSKFYIYMLIHL